MKKRERILLIVSVFLIFWGFTEVFLSLKKTTPEITSAHPAIASLIAPDIQEATEAVLPPNEALSLIIEPADTTAPVISMIESAKKSLDLIIYTLNDKKIEAALVDAKKRGVSVRVILNAGFKGVPSKKNQTTFDFLKTNGIKVEWSPTYFALTHQKTLIADSAVALIMTFNLDKTYYKKDRDFGVIDSDATDVAAIESSFNSDWVGDKKKSSDGRDLVWSPGSEDVLVALIDSAQKSLLVYNEEMDEENIEDALQRAARRGVDVEVLMSMQTSWLPAFRALAASGVHIHTYDAKAPLYIHAKMILADSTNAFLGSENFSAPSLNDNRELGIIIKKAGIVSSLVKTFQSDWAEATPFVP